LQLSKLKYQISIIVLACLSVIWILGCGGDNSNQQAKNINQAINYAIRVFERYSGSQIISLKNQPEIALTSITGPNAGKLKSVQQISKSLISSQHLNRRNLTMP